MSNIDIKHDHNAFVVNINKITCTCIYFIIYAGYLKVLFAGIDQVFEIIQYLAFAVGIFVCLRPTQRSLRIYKETFTPINYIILMFLCLAFGYFYTNNSQLAASKLIGGVTTLLFMFMLYFLGSILYERKWIEQLLRTIISWNIFFIFLYVVLNFRGLFSSFSTGVRIGDADSNPIWIARICADTIIILFAARTQGQFKRRNKVLLVFALIAVCIATGSKGPLIAAIIVLSYYIIRHEKTDIKILIFISAIVLLAIVLPLLVSNDNDFFRNRFSLETVLSNSPGYRVHRYYYTLIHIPEKIFFGHGLGSWPREYWASAAFIPVWQTAEQLLIDYPHNIFLEMIYEGGIVPFLLFLLGINNLRNKYKAIEHQMDIVMLYLLATNILYGMFSGSVTSGNRGIYYFFAINCGILANVSYRRTNK